MYDFFSISRECAASALSFWGTVSLDAISSSRRLGWDKCQQIMFLMFRRIEWDVTYRDSQVITASQLSDLTNASERSTHDNSLVSKLLVVVEDALDGCNSWVFLLAVGLSGLGLVPIENTADEGRDEESSGFGSGDGLDFGEEKGKVAIDGVLLLKDTGGLDTFPGGSDLDEDAGFVDADGFVELKQSA
jgi:hypothetical protein